MAIKNYKKFYKGCCAACCTIAFLGAGTFFGTMLTVIIKDSDITKLANNNGYQEANAIYMQVEIDKLDEQLYSMGITPQEYVSEIDKIKDLSVDYYMSGDNIPQQAKEEYSALKEDKEICRSVIYSSIGMLAVGSFSTMGFLYAIDKQEEQENKNNGLIQSAEKMTSFNNEQ